MYFTDRSVILRHRNYREFDRIVTVFTKEYGKLEVVFKGVRKPQAKLRCLSEVMCHSDLRFYVSKYNTMPVCTGGEIIESYHLIRNSIEKMIDFMFIADITANLTPLNQKSNEKYFLLVEALDYLSSVKNVSKWFKIVFIFNFLEYFGTGFKRTQLGYDEHLWDILHSGFKRIEELNKSEYDEFYIILKNFATEQLNEYTPRKIDISDYDRFKWRNYEFSGYYKCFK